MSTGFLIGREKENLEVWVSPDILYNLEQVILLLHSVFFFFWTLHNNVTLGKYFDLLKKKTRCGLDVLILISMQNGNVEFLMQIKMVKKQYLCSNLYSVDCKNKRFWHLVWTFPKRLWKWHLSLRNIYPEVLPLELNEVEYIQKISNTFLVALKVIKTKQEFYLVFFPDQTLTHCPTHIGNQWYWRCQQKIGIFVTSCGNWYHTSFFFFFLLSIRTILRNI